MSLKRRTATILGLALWTLAGCGSGISYEHAKVHGKVTYKGKPVTFGSVLFVPVEPPKDGLMQPASGAIQPDGSYELKSEADTGAIVGEHKVVVIAVEGDKIVEDTSKEDAAPTPAAGPSRKSGGFKSAVPKKYADPTSTPLTRKVATGDNTIDIELTD